MVTGALLRRGSLDPDRRRLSLGPSIPHRGSDVGLDPNHAAILFRDSRGVSLNNHDVIKSIKYYMRAYHLNFCSILVFVTGMVF